LAAAQTWLIIWVAGQTSALSNNFFLSIQTESLAFALWTLVFVSALTTEIEYSWD